MESTNMKIERKAKITLEKNARKTEDGSTQEDAEWTY